MQHLEASGAVRPLYELLGVKRLRKLNAEEPQIFGATVQNLVARVYLALGICVSLIQFYAVYKCNMQIKWHVEGENKLRILSSNDMSFCIDHLLFHLSQRNVSSALYSWFTIFQVSAIVAFCDVCREKCCYYCIICFGIRMLFVSVHVSCLCLSSVLVNSDKL